MRRSCETDIPQEFAQCKVSLDALDVDERRAVKPDDRWEIPAIVHGENSRPEL